MFDIARREDSSSSHARTCSCAGSFDFFNITNSHASETIGRATGTSYLKPTLILAPRTDASRLPVDLLTKLIAVRTADSFRTSDRPGGSNHPAFFLSGWQRSAPCSERSRCQSPLFAYWLSVRPVAAQGYSHGVFVGTQHGPIELTAYAEVVTNGQLRMAKGSRENIPTLSDIQRVLCNLPNWEPGAIMIANQAIFLDEKAERRELRFAVRRLNISALELRVEDLERKDRLGAVDSGRGRVGNNRRRSCSSSWSGTA